jgi:hypothetical protein
MHVLVRRTLGFNITWNSQHQLCLERKALRGLALSICGANFTCANETPDLKVNLMLLIN